MDRMACRIDRPVSGNPVERDRDPRTRKKLRNIWAPNAYPLVGRRSRTHRESERRSQRRLWPFPQL